MSDWKDDYNLLGLGGLTSLVTNIKVALWGNEVLIECVYNPEERSLMCWHLKTVAISGGLYTLKRKLANLKLNFLGFVWANLLTGSLLS
jgi:hypothetical protein